MKVIKYILVVLVTVLPALMSGSCSSLFKPSDPAQVRADSIANAYVRSLVEHQTFMMTGDRITARNSRMMSVIPNSNFIVVDGKEAIIQISPRIGAGPNGVGGFTFKGDVSSYTVKPKKNGEVTVGFHFSSTDGRAGDVSMVVYKGGTQATAYINSTFYRGKTQMWGEVSGVDLQRLVIGSHR